MISLDHVGFVGTDLAAMAARMRSLGLAPTEPKALQARDPATGKSRSLHQQSCHVVLERGYIELTAVQTDDPAHHLAAWLPRGAGAHILALGAEPVLEMHGRCAAAGLAPTAVARATRPIHYGALRGDAAFDWFMLPAAQFAPALLCLVHNLRPELVYQREVMRHPLGARALATVTLVMDEPRRAAQRQLAWLGAPAAELDDRCAWDLSHGRLELVSPAGAMAQLGIDCFGARWRAGGIVAIGLQVADLEHAARFLRTAGVPSERAAGELRVAPELANGALLRLRA